MRKKRGQTWSIDLVLGVVIFILVVAVFYTLIIREPEPRASSLQEKAEFISNRLDADVGTEVSYAIVKDKDIDASGVQQLIQEGADYQELKEKLGLDEDFCIYLEDENGNVVPMEDSSGNLVNGVGSPDITIGGLPCGSIV